jgi:hypothetical protein
LNPGTRDSVQTMYLIFFPAEEDSPMVESECLAFAILHTYSTKFLTVLNSSMNSAAVFHLLMALPIVHNDIFAFLFGCGPIDRLAMLGTELCNTKSIAASLL